MSDPTDELLAVVTRSRLPALLVRVPDLTVLAASEQAAHVIGIHRDKLVGGNFQDFADPTGMAAAVSQGLLTGFEAERQIHLPDGADRHVQMWVRAIEQPPLVEFTIAVLWPAGDRAMAYLPVPGADEPRAIFGTVSAELIIERISEDVSVLGLDGAALVGAPLLRLFVVDSAADVMVAVAQASTRQGGVCVRVQVPSEDAGLILATFAIKRLLPFMSFVFALVIGESEENGGTDAEKLLRGLSRGLRSLDMGEALANLDRLQLPGAERLSGRE